MVTLILFRSFFYFQLILASYAGNRNLIHDYFVFKNVARVAGLSCGEVENDYQVIKLFNDVGIPASVKYLNSNVNVSRYLHTSYWNLGVYLDLRCPFSDEIVTKLFDEASACYTFEHLHQWLILTENMNRTVQLLNDSTFSIITDVAIAVKENDDYVLYDVYNHCKRCGRWLNVTKLGTWTRNDGLKITLSTEKFTRRWDYHKTKIKIAGFVAYRPEDQKLEDYLRNHNDIYKDNFSKSLYSLMIHLQDVFNLRFELIEESHWEKNDTSGPVATGLKNHKFDLSYYPMILSHDRLNLANVLVQVIPLRTCFMFLTVPSAKMDVNVIFRPFARNVWYMLLVLTGIIIFILWIIFKLGKDDVDTVLIILAAISQQGFPFNSKQFASRFAFLQTMFFGLLLYNCYAGAIVSARLNIPLNKMNDSLYSLVNSKMKLGATKEKYLNVLMNSTVHEIQYFKKYWLSIPETERYYTISDGIKKIKKLGFAYHSEPLKAYPLIERTFDNQMICQLTEVHWLRPSSLGVWSSPHSQFADIAKIGIIRMITSGIQKREAIRWRARKPFCDKDQQYMSSVTIHEALPIMLVLFFGIILSVMIYFMEEIIFRILQRREKRIKQ